MIRGIFKNWKDRYIKIIDNYMTIAKKPNTLQVALIDLKEYNI